MADILALHPGLARRTAQRRVNSLVTAGKIRPLGAGRARRYLAATAPAAPLAQRNPVGYQRDFLDAHQPNRTRYLAEPLRRQLHMMGNNGQKRLSN